MSAVADVLRAAADRLERTGKADGKLRARTEGVAPEDCPACAAGAIVDAGAAYGGQHGAFAALYHFLDSPRCDLLTIFRWSDSHSLAEVVAGLRAAADGAE